MTDINSLLIEKYPFSDERIEGRLVYLNNYGVTRFASPLLEERTKISFFNAKFSTGYRKFRTIDVIIGLRGSDELFTLTNPVFSDKYSNLPTELEKISASDINNSLIFEIVELYKLAGSKITVIDNNKFQIWFGEDKWRIMSFDTSGTLRIKTTPNYQAQDEKRSWWERLFGR